MYSGNASALVSGGTLSVRASGNSATGSLGGCNTALQGNVDPGILRAPVPVIREAVAQCLASHAPGPGHIMHLGHGITPDATVAAARAFVEAAQEFGPAYGGEPA